MRSVFHRSTKDVGAPPGTLVHTGEALMERPIISLITYGSEGVEEHPDVPLDRCISVDRDGRIIWLNVDGLHDVSVIERLGECFGIHALVLEDILNTDHRPKVEDLGDYVYVALRMFDWDPEASHVTVDQVSLIVGKGFVISFQEEPGDTLDPLRECIREHRGRMTSRGADYLAYAILDAVVDNYFVVLEHLGESIEQLEGLMTNSASAEALTTLYSLKRDALTLRKGVWPLREVANSLVRGEVGLFEGETLPFMRDLYDHVIEVMETLEAFRDQLQSMVDIHMTLAGNRMNEIMKVLTIIGTLFIPLTFLVGVYGMNFRHMPEIEWPWAYPALWGIMLVTAGAMLVYFRRKKWL